ncbi:DUF6990 domain-containing protein [Oleidesulfovibrio alaskensis]
MEHREIWLSSLLLGRGLRHATLPTAAPGTRPIWHLAALVLPSDAAKLKFYQASFEAGDRLGFVPYITKDYIDRAMSLAGEYSSGFRSRMAQIRRVENSGQ